MRFWYKLTSLSKGIIIGSVITLWVVGIGYYVRENPKNIFDVLSCVLLVVLLLNVYKYVYEPIKKRLNNKKVNKEKAKLESILSNSISIQHNLILNLNLLSARIEKEISRPGASEEFQIEYVDQFLKRKTSIEVVITTMEKTIHWCETNLSHIRQVQIMRMNFSGYLLPNALIHDSLEDVIGDINERNNELIIHFELNIINETSR